MVKVAVGIILVESMVLVCQRKKESRYALQWEFPGGKLEQGESPQECLVRELREELSIEAKIGEEYHRQQWIYPDSGSFEVFYYLVSSFAGKVTNNVFENLRWVSFHELQTIAMLDGNKNVIGKLLASYSKL
jgi:8-oxo-dGTP diphosphatase